jgi:hypothetical protein
MLVLCAPIARANSLFLSVPDLNHNIQVNKVDVKYTVYDKANGIGKFSATGTAYSFAGVSNNITGGMYRVETYFDLATGAVRYSDTRNLIDVTGTLASMSQTFFHSTVLQQFGAGSEDTFDLLFQGNTGTVLPHNTVATRIFGVSIGTDALGTAVHDPNFKYASLLTNSSVSNGYVIWDNTPLASGIEKGTANVWAPMPTAASGGLFLMAGLAAHAIGRRTGRPQLQAA